MFIHKCYKSGIVILTVAACFNLFGCDTPVFRYALEKWKPEAYNAFVFFDNNPDNEEKKTANLLNQPFANITLELINIAELNKGFDVGQYEFKGKKKKYRKSNEQITAEKKLAAAKRAFHHKLKIYNSFGKEKSLPYAVVTFPADRKKTPSKASQLLWEGKPDSQKFAALIDSPARKEIAKRILDGDSAVWIMIPSGDTQKDDECLAKINEILEKAEKTVELSIPGADVKLSAGIPLKLSFSTLIVNPNNPEEDFFIKMLMKLRDKRHAGSNLSQFQRRSNIAASRNKAGSIPADSPIIIPVIGRGRAVELIGGENINEDYIINLCKYISGPCSCEIKKQNPGMDMLFSIDWKNRFAPMIGADEEPGELIGFEAFIK